MDVALKIWRFDSKTGERALRTYEVDAPEWACLLDVLDLIKDKVDGTLAYRKSCRMMICGSCGMRMDGRAVLACKERMKPIVDAGHVPVISAMGNLPSSATWSWTWARSGRRSARSSRTSSRATRSRRNVSGLLAGADEPDPQGSALHHVRLLRLGVQLDGVRPRVPRPGRAREGVPLRRRPARQGGCRAAERVQPGARDLGLHALLLLQRALPEGRRSARRDRKARGRVDPPGHRPRHGRQARELVRHVGEDDGLAARDRARPQDAGDRLGAQGDALRVGARAARQGADPVPAACGRGRQGGARALQPGQGTRQERGGGNRPGREGPRTHRVPGGGGSAGERTGDGAGRRAASAEG